MATPLRLVAVPSLAVELTDMIIDFLHDDKPSLRSCALVSRGWLDASRYHLFQSIRLVGVASEWGVEPFLQLLDTKLRLCRYVRNLDVLGERWYSPHQHVKGSCLGPVHLAAFVALPFLRSLTLTSVVWDKERVAAIPGPLRALDSLTLSHFTSFGSGAAFLQDVLAVITPFSQIAALHLLRTNVRLDPSPPGPPLQVAGPVRLRALFLGPVSRTSTLYPALTRLRCFSTIQSLKIEMGDWAQVSDVALFMRDAARDVTRLELDVSSCRSVWVDLDPEVLLDGADWFRDLQLAGSVPVLSFRLSVRSDPPSVFWSMLLSALSALPATVRDVSVVAKDIMPNGFHELAKLSRWQQLADGIDDFRLPQHARASFYEKLNAVLRQRETLFSNPNLAVCFTFIPEVTEC